MTAARRLIGTGGAKIIEADMTDGIAGEGMARGEMMRVLLEDIGN